LKKENESKVEALEERLVAIEAMLAEIKRKLE